MTQLWGKTAWAPGLEGFGFPGTKGSWEATSIGLARKSTVQGLGLEVQREWKQSQAHLSQRQITVKPPTRFK